MVNSVVRQIKVMISSTRADLAQYREEASRVISQIAAEKERQVQLVELSMEKETQSGNREFAVAVSKAWVDKADWLVLIIGWNYGTISDEPGADGLGITEWEYKHAFESGKKLFVFMTGDSGTANRYRVSDEEREDLKDWIPKQTPEQSAKLDHFRHEVAQRHAEMFTNLNAFRERLAKTLRNAIDDLPPEVQPGTPLADLIVAVMPNIRDCIRKVTLIANCKRVHDQLHEIRQHVIRPLREEVLSMWQQEGVLSISRERVIWRCMAKRSEAIGGISAVRSSITPDHQGLRESIDAVIQRPAPWDIDAASSESRPDRASFTEAINMLAIDVQDAFSEADRSMANEESNLRERYLALLDDLKRAQQQRELSAADQKRISNELEKVENNRGRVKDSLTCHHRWQEVHDKLEEVDAFRESNEFSRKLNYFRGTPLGKVTRLVEEELREIGNNKSDTNTDAKSASSNTSTPRHPDAAFSENLLQLQVSLEQLRNGAGSADFDTMRKLFDNAFYYVDKRTLGEVERAQERVMKLEDWLDELAAAQKKAV